MNHPSLKMNAIYFNVKMIVLRVTAADQPFRAGISHLQRLPASITRATIGIPLGRCAPFLDNRIEVGYEEKQWAFSQLLKSEKSRQDSRRSLMELFDPLPAICIT